MNNLSNVTSMGSTLNFPQLTSTTDFQAAAMPLYMTTDMSRPNDALLQKLKSNHLTTDTSQSKDEIAHSYWLKECRLGRVIRRTDTGAALGVVGNRYTTVSNSPLYNMLCHAVRDSLPLHMAKNLELKEVSSFGGAYTRFELAFPEMRHTLLQRGSETEIMFKVGISNTFDGNGSVRVFSGAYDLVCENGMTIGEVEKKSARHTSGFTPTKFSSFLQQSISDYGERCREWQRWADTNSSAETFKNVLELNKVSERKIGNLVDQYNFEAQSRGHTAFAAYSALTFYSSHDSARFGVRNSSTADNAAATVEQREREVSKILLSDSWSSLLKVA